MGRSTKTHEKLL